MNFTLSDKRMETAILLTNSIFPLMILPVATFGNSLCFLVFCRAKFQKRLTRTSSICLRLLCINDSIVLYLFIIDVLLRIYMKPSIRIYSTPLTCRLYKFIRYSFLDMSAYLQLGLTTDRFICCVHHTYYSHWRKKNYLYYLLSIAFFLIFLKNSSFLSTFYGYPGLYKNRTITKCSVRMDAKRFATYMAYGQTLIDVVFITCLPFFLILYFNSRILREVLRLRTTCWSTITRLIHLTPGQNETTIRNQTVILTRHHGRHRRLHLTFALGCISFVFVLSTAPYKIFKIVERHDKLIRDQQKHGVAKSLYIQLAEVIIDCLEYISCSTPFFVCLLTSIESNGQFITTENPLSCRQTYRNRGLAFFCPAGSIIKEFDFSNVSNLDDVQMFQVIGEGGRGPLTTIPKNICLLRRLKQLYLRNNQISNVAFDFESECLPDLELLDLRDNYLRTVPDRWISQMPYLTYIFLSDNKLTCLPNTMFYNISNVGYLDVRSNNLISFELWLLQIKILIDYSNNPVTHFTNDYNVDLSNYQSNVTRNIYFHNSKRTNTIDFDDRIFPMYNCCNEAHSTSSNKFIQAVLTMFDNNQDVFKLNCSCNQYYLQKHYVIFKNIDFSTWRCGNSSQTFHEMCSNQSSFDFTNVLPRFCRIDQSEQGDVPRRMESGLCNSKADDLPTVSSQLYEKLIKINLLDEINANVFVVIIDEYNDKLQPFISSTNSKFIENIFQNIISHIEYLIESINTNINITLNSVAILSISKNSSIYSFSQINQTESYLTYSTDINSGNSIATITVDQTSLNNLNETDVYTFFYLPSILFQLALNNQNIIIVSPIVGFHSRGNSPRLISMSFIDIERQYGKYSCVFWQKSRWNESGCSYSLDRKSNRHWCYCNHTTSFALIFIPHKTIPKTYIPSITVSAISIVCFSLSIILSIYHQTTSFRHLSITNIFTLSNSIVLCILLTVTLIRGYQSNKKTNGNCSVSEENLVITTYFFLLTTFASKTLLGICYFLTIFFHFVFIQLTAISNKWFYGSFFLVICIALIPTIIIKIIFTQWNNIFLQYQGICWFNSSYIFLFISIPLIVFMSVNLVIIFGITVRLIRFSISRKTIKTNEKRLIISMMIWIALCVSLGIAWIFGPVLDVIITEKEETSSIITFWIFSMFTGLEGVWVLIVNVIFYFIQKVNKKNRQMISNKYKK